MKVLVHRGYQIESIHNVNAVVARSDGTVLETYGDGREIIYPRSAIKPFQALPIILSGAYNRFSLGARELVLASASHSGETFHTDCVERWLKKIDLREIDLECGAHAPLNMEATYELVRRGKKFSQLHNNCSGKHTGMLTVARHLDIPTKGYVNPDHQIQQIIKTTIEEMIQHKIRVDGYGIDGCSIPSWQIPLDRFAIGLARFASGNFLDSKLRLACLEIFEACQKYPEYIAGTDRFCTNIIKECKGKALIKTGAEGVMAAIIKEPIGMGIAVKCVDGAARAAEVAMAALLNKYKILSSNSVYLTKPIINWNNIVTGRIEVKL